MFREKAGLVFLVEQSANPYVADTGLVLSQDFAMWSGGQFIILAPLSSQFKAPKILCLLSPNHMLCFVSTKMALSNTEQDF